MNAHPTPLRTPAEDALLRLFPDVVDMLPGDAPVAALRRDAFDRFVAGGLPHRRVEEWKYTDLRANLRHVAPIARPADAARLAAVPHVLGALAVRRLVVANGVFVPEASDLADLEPGLTVASLEAALVIDSTAAATLSHLGAAARVNPAIGLNTAFMQGGVVIDIAPGTRLARPIEIAVITEGEAAQAVYARSILRVGDGASATVYETFADSGVANQTNAVLQVIAGDDVALRLNRVIAEDNATVHLGSLDVTLGARTQLDTFSAVLGGGFVRVQPFVTFRGDHSAAHLRGVALLHARRHADTTLVVEHDAPHCTSRELFKSVVDDEGRSVFQGKIVVPSHAQKTDGKMMSQALLLSEGAEADAKPELEIFADDVICGHGATVGALDADLLFYLRARGIPKAEAEAMLIVAFLGQVTDEAGDETLAEVVLARAEAWMLERSARARGRAA